MICKCITNRIQKTKERELEMEEKILNKSEQYDVKKIFRKIVIIGAILSVLTFIFFILDEAGCFGGYNLYNNSYEIYLEHQQRGSCYKEGELCNWCTYVNNHTRFGEAISGAFRWYLLPSLIPFGVFLVIGALVYFWLRSYELIVTDKRIYGKVAWGKRVDLPVDSVSATSTIKFLKGVAVATSSGKISFLVIKNAEDIYNTINKLIIERQQKKNNSTPIVSTFATDETDKLKKYKDLLDSGVISQEEFDAKKKQLLGL